MESVKQQLEQLQEKLTAAETPEALAAIVKQQGMDLPEADAQLLWKKTRSSAQELNDDTLNTVSGGFDVDSIPQYETIKQYYLDKGPNLAFTLCIYFIPSPLCYEIIEVIEDELRQEL